MNLDQARTLRVGSIIKTNCALGQIGAAGQLVIVARVDIQRTDGSSWLGVYYGPGFASGGPGPDSSWNPCHFDLWAMDHDVAVKNLTPALSQNLQLQSFAHGYGWGRGSPGECMHTDKPRIVFYPTNAYGDKRILWGDGDGSRLCLDASVEIQFHAAMLMFGGSIATRTIDQILPPDVLSLLQHSPTSSLLRGLIRAATNKAVPLDTMQAGTDAIIEWIIQATAPPAPPALTTPVPRVIPPQANNQTAQPPVGDRAGDWLDLTLHADDEERRVVRFRFVDERSYRQTYSGEIPVPIEILNCGIDAVDDWVLRQARDDYDGTVCECEDSDPTVELIDMDINSADVIARNATPPAAPPQDPLAIEAAAQPIPAAPAEATAPF